MENVTSSSNLINSNSSNVEETEITKDLNITSISLYNNYKAESLDIFNASNLKNDSPI